MEVFNLIYTPIENVAYTVSISKHNNYIISLHCSTNFDYAYAYAFDLISSRSACTKNNLFSLRACLRSEI